MRKLSRRSVLRSSLGMAAIGALARPVIANAAAKTAEVWWIQGFAEEEDTAFKKIVAAYEKASGNTIDYSIIPYAPMRQKIVSVVTSGTVPDLFQSSPVEAITLFAWDGKLVDVTDVVDTQREEYSETALLSAYCYNSKEKKRSFTLCPIQPQLYPTIFGGRWSRRPDSRWKTFPRRGMPIMNSSKKSRRSCVINGCETFMGLASS
jgi:multiple sugar transport system substrate-binding protein